MSLISDTGYLLHHIRLSYLRDADDRYGARIMSLDPSYQGNPYIVAAGLADQDRWHELAMPSSPNISENEDGNASGFPGAKLKYTQTIMGRKSGGLGLRVHGKRASTSKRVSHMYQHSDVNTAVGAPPPPETLSTSAPPISNTLVNNNPNLVVNGDSNADHKEKEQPDTPVGPNVQIQQATAPEEAPVATKVVQFVPKFTAETEARRRMRIAARRGPGAIAPKPPPKPLSFDTSSEEEVETNAHTELSSDEDFGNGNGAESMDEPDEFDPDYAATRTAATSDSDGNSVFSGNSSIPNSSAPDSATRPNYRQRPRFSPVTERSKGPPTRLRGERPADLEGATLVSGSKSEGDVSHHKKQAEGMVRSRSDNPSSHQPSPSSDLTLTFARKLPPAKPHKSALSSMLASTTGSSNPFTEMYGAISGRGESASTNVRVYFPHATQPSGKPMELNVRKDATVEEVIGFALWNYWEENWSPKLDDGLKDDDPKRSQRLSAVGWILRIAEDDGEVDDDFPPPDRMAKILKFNSDAYAVLEATPNQIQQNEILESKIQRRPSRTMTSKKPAGENKLTVPGPVVPMSGIGTGGGSFMGSMLGSLPLSTSLGPSSGHGPQIFLRIRVADAADVHISTTIPVSAGMYMQEALEMVCKRRKLENIKDYALVLRLPGSDAAIMVPLDRTVASLQGNRELLLVRRNMLHTLGFNVSKEIKTTDPNASIFKGMSETPEQHHSSPFDFTAAYKKYPIYRKMPMLVTRQERTLAIDGVYIHIMPSTNRAKAVFDNGKTSSYHIRSVVDCQQSAKSAAFKLILSRGSGNKRYDFEAESPKVTAEIVQTIKGLKTALERSGTLTKSRRSRQVV